MRGQAGFFDIDERLKDLSAKGDDLERRKALVDFEMFRSALEQAVPRADRSKGGRPPFDHVFMFKGLILQTMHAFSDERCEYLIKDRLSFMRFLGLGLAGPVPDANTIGFHLTGSEASGSCPFEIILDIGPDITPRAAMTDKGYDARTNREATRGRGICDKPKFFTRKLYKGRARIEQTMGKLKRFKRIALRCEKTAQNYRSLVAWALRPDLDQIHPQTA